MSSDYLEKLIYYVLSCSNEVDEYEDATEDGFAKFPLAYSPVLPEGPLKNRLSAMDELFELPSEPRIKTDDLLFEYTIFAGRDYYYLSAIEAAKFYVSLHRIDKQHYYVAAVARQIIQKEEVKCFC